MAQVQVINLQTTSFVVPPPVARTLTPRGTVTVSLDPAQLQNPALTSLVSQGLISLVVSNDPDVADNQEGSSLAQVAASAYDCSLAAAAEAANAIVVTGQVRDGLNASVEAATTVYVESVSPTVGKGFITVTAGTSVLVINDAAGRVHRAWITSTAAGAFAVSIADDTAESNLLVARVNNGVSNMLTLTFA